MAGPLLQAAGPMLAGAAGGGAPPPEAPMPASGGGGGDGSGGGGKANITIIDQSRSAFGGGGLGSSVGPGISLALSKALGRAFGVKLPGGEGAEAAEAQVGSESEDANTGWSSDLKPMETSLAQIEQTSPYDSFMGGGDTLGQVWDNYVNTLTTGILAKENAKDGGS